MTTFGNLRIVASGRVDGAGPFEGQPVFLHWPWYWHLPRLSPWALLVLAIALPRANRRREALLIFVPMVVLGLLWQTVTRTTGMPSVTAVQLGFLVEFFLAGLALLWLNAGRLGRRRGLSRLVGSLALMLLAGLVVFLSYGRTLAGAQGAVILVFTTILAVVLLVSLALTRRLARRRYRPLPFMLWLFACCLLCSLAGLTALMGVVVLMNPSGVYSLPYFVAQVIVPSLVLGLGVYVINLPYMLLMFRCSFFRQRFRTWLGVESLPPHVQAANPEGLCSGN